MFDLLRNIETDTFVDDATGVNCVERVKLPSLQRIPAPRGRVLQQRRLGRHWRGAVLLFAALTLAEDASANESADQVVVYKSKRELLLLRRGTVIRTYHIALGRNPAGAKRREGDGRRPEGSYLITGRNARSAFHRSLRISYPSTADRERARREGVKPGGDIMIHGLPNGEGQIGAAHRMADWTEGCIAATNEEIEEIWRLVADGTPIQIKP